MKVLVTGGAGYVGGVSVDAILAAGHDVVVLDDLTTGHVAIVPPGAHLVRGTYGDEEAVQDLLEDEGIDAILHCAARSLVGESVRDPAKYYRDNVAGGIALLEAARGAGVRRVVFSSTAAVYGVPASTPILEDAPLAPDQHLRRDEAHLRGRAALVRRGLRVAERDPALLQRRGRHGAPGRGPPPRDAPHPQRPAGGRGRPAAHALRRGLPDARRDARSATTSTSRTSRRRTWRRSRRRTPAIRARARARAPREPLDLQPRHVERLLGARGAGRGGRRRRRADPAHGRARAAPAIRRSWSPPTSGRGRSWAGRRAAPPCPR